MQEMTLAATGDKLSRVMAFIEGTLEANDCPLGVQSQIAVAVGEVFTSISLCAYSPETGDMTVRCSVEPEPPTVVVQFIDDGRPCAPTTKRSGGKRGLPFVRAKVDDLAYSYERGRNIITIRKAW